MKNPLDTRRILELWEQGITQAEVARLVECSLYLVKMSIHRYGSLENYETSLKGISAPNTNYQATKREYIIVHKQHRKRSYTDQQLKDAVAESFSMAEVLRKINLRPAGGNYDLVKYRIKEMGLDTSHFTGSRWLQGKTNHTTRKRSLEDILVKDSTYTTTSDLKRRLLAEGIFQYRCVSCGLEDWLGSPIPLEIDHRNGDRRDNRLENLRLLCPNCHAMTVTYRGKNKGAQRI